MPTTEDDQTLRQRFSQALVPVPTGVTIVSTSGTDGPCAQTVSAMCSVSTEPPLLLVCVNQRSPLNAAIEQSGDFCVNILTTSHDHVADTFAGRPWPGKGRWDFSCGEWGTAPSGSPVLTDAFASFDCALTERVQAGSHFIYVGLVTSVDGELTGTPLAYADRGYAALAPIEPSAFADHPDAHPANRASSQRHHQKEATS